MRVTPVLGLDRRMSFQVLLANQGNVHLVPKGTLKLAREDGAAIGEAELPETTPLLPGVEGPMATQGQFDLAPGRYRAQATVDFGGAQPATGEVTFSPAANLVIESMSASEIPGKGPLLALALTNRSEVAILPRVQLAVRGLNGDVLGTVSPPRPPLLWPGQRNEVAIPFPSALGTGEYILVARVEYGGAAPLMQELRFRIGTPAPTPNPAWARGAPEALTQPRPAWPLRVGLLAVLAVALILLLWLPALAPLRRQLGRAGHVLLGKE